ncbi:MAG TPA: hypothetical protein EYH31_04455 [Anaerolineae bacterium]|nr:hypothetical protein [Anaerolineae bacterium]
MRRLAVFATLLMLMVFGLLVALLAAEIGLRLMPGLLPEPVLYVEEQIYGRQLRAHQATGIQHYREQLDSLYLPDDYLGDRFPPGIDVLLEGHPEFTYRVRTTSLGLGDVGFRDDGLDKPPFAVAVGDSFTWGYGVEAEQDWVELLEQRTGLDFANLGMPGYGTVQNERVLMRYGLRLRPQLILWGYFPNDLEDSARFQGWLDSGTGGSFTAWKREQKVSAQRQAYAVATARANPGSPLLRLRGWLSTHSLTYELVKYTLRRGVYLELRGEVPVRYRKGDLQLVFSPTFFSAWDPDSPLGQRGWQLTQEALRRSRAAAEDSGAVLIVVLIPPKEQVYWPRLAPHVPPYDIEKPLARMRAFCEQEGIRYIDLTPTFAHHAAADEQLYFNQDGHLNAAGHALAAEVVYAYLQKNSLIPVPTACSSGT